jgi:hypothetical protein
VDQGKEFACYANLKAFGHDFAEVTDEELAHAIVLSIIVQNLSKVIKEYCTHNQKQNIHNYKFNFRLAYYFYNNPYNYYGSCKPKSGSRRENDN